MTNKEEFPLYEVDVTFNIAVAYPLLKEEDYVKYLNKIDEWFEKVKKRIEDWKREGLIEESILEKFISEKETNDLGKAYLDVRYYMPPKVAYYLTANNIEEEALYESLSRLIVFLNVAKRYINERLEIRKRAEMFPELARKYEIKYKT